MTLKRRARLFNTTMLKVMTYGSETWSPMKAENNMLAVTESGEGNEGSCRDY